MMSRIDRIRRAFAARRSGRMRAEGAKASDSAQLPVPVGPPEPTSSSQRPSRRHGDAEFAAHLMGQDGQKRGLRAGSPLLDLARNTYNRVEWSGTRDRRARNGRKARADV